MDERVLPYNLFNVASCIRTVASKFSIGVLWVAWGAWYSKNWQKLNWFI